MQTRHDACLPTLARRTPAPAPQPGLNRRRRGPCQALASIGLVITIAMAGCGGDGDEPAAAAGQSPAHGQHGGAEQPRHQQPPLPVAVASATRGDIASHYTATATLAAEKEAEILARVGGVVGALSCEEGDLVEKGAELLRISNDEYRLRLVQAEAKTANLTARHERMQGMLEKDLVSAEDFEQVKADLRGARAEEGLAHLNLSYTRVDAPFAGCIVSRLVDPGQNVSIGTPLFLLADFDPLLARVHVPSREFKQLQVDQTVELILDSTGERLRGRIKLVSPIIDPTSGTIKLTVEVSEYPPHTRPGDFAEVRIVTEHRTGTTLVPKTAVVTDRGDQVVYVAVGSTAERRVVEVGFADDLHAEILDGLAPGEEIVVKGQRSLRHGAPIRVLEGGRGDASTRRMGGPGNEHSAGTQRPGGRQPGMHAPGERRPGGQRPDGHLPDDRGGGRQHPGGPRPGGHPPAAPADSIQGDRPADGARSGQAGS